MKSFIRHLTTSSGAITLNHFRTKLKSKTKSTQSDIVTKADLASERNIIKKIKSKYPNHNIIAEETGFDFKQSEYTWIVDPLDGTSNYAAGIPWFGILIALLKNWQPIKAAIYLPYNQEFYYAEKEKGTFLNNERVFVTKEKELKKTLVGYSLDYSPEKQKTEKEVKIIKLLVENSRNLRATNSCLDSCHVACGQYGGYLNQTACIWDWAAPSLIIKEAGGKVTNILGKELNFKVNADNYTKNYTFLAASQPLHPQLLKLVKRVL